ncbi:MAG: zinc-dependent alcohol dehydrogenase family protein [Rhodospirillales bacterium]|jgi:NADPH:quinone reductase-like Zn-dependent oxidoreductase|nr:alcohol dehydrogenase [Rhodospirillaceae bacterium]MDP6430186.1 zinc-dependent alcohol dehydrogenase family protein [Rhodospirillales bacterium]MDP6644183.1 zinc-dependent alcohol dehydrogenase family protein [Rhodospirillales bacterium]MDP6843333.1 zinc-dependent alcohol dehydrogenase family protein [Rhodospirillales bacterium]
MKAASISKYGAPLDVVECVDVADLGEPGAGRVVVRMALAPINPADLLTIKGDYARDVEFPFIPGTEGVGRVEAVGEGVAAVEVGDLVVPMPRGTWQERLLVRENLLIKVPAGGPLRQLAMLKVNPATADGLLSEFGPLEAGDWVMQNVANGGVGQCVVQLAADIDVKTVNIVRRGDAVDPLLALGANVVLVDDLSDPARLKAAVHEAIGDAHIKLGFDAIAGPASGAMAAALGDGAELVVYGTQGQAPVQLDGRRLFQNGLALRGFWLTAWYRATPLDKIGSVLNRLAGKVAAGTLRSEVEAVYPLAQAGEAAAHADRPGRSGKILIALDPETAG